MSFEGVENGAGLWKSWPWVALKIPPGIGVDDDIVSFDPACGCWNGNIHGRVNDAENLERVLQDGCLERRTSPRKVSTSHSTNGRLEIARTTALGCKCRTWTEKKMLACFY